MKLDKPMTQHDFQQVCLLANMIAICEMVIKREKPNSLRRAAYSKLLRDAKRIEVSIPGHLNDRTLDASVVFYNDMQEAVGKFLNSFKGGGDVS